MLHCLPLHCTYPLDTAYIALTLHNDQGHILTLRGIVKTRHIFKFKNGTVYTGYASWVDLKFVQLGTSGDVWCLQSLTTLGYLTLLPSNIQLISIAPWLACTVWITTIRMISYTMCDVPGIITCLVQWKYAHIWRWNDNCMPKFGIWSLALVEIFLLESKLESFYNMPLLLGLVVLYVMSVGPLLTPFLTLSTRHCRLYKFRINSVPVNL